MIMISSSDILTLVFGLIATVIGVGAILVVRRQNTLAVETDTEFGLLNPIIIPSPLNALDEGIRDPSSIGRHAEEGNQLHQVIGDSLEVFSRHLRAQN
ncbi:hypothetical protein BDZ45DRAFT_745230 [Acephala macrosclerotiorum]|nr:hypothetical protein BDZ45DRAFT_745230 [Acephala macrosclerotiorum]